LVFVCYGFGGASLALAIRGPPAPKSRFRSGRITPAHIL
jgi:hypothetical protein